MKYGQSASLAGGPVWIYRFAPCSGSLHTRNCESREPVMIRGKAGVIIGLPLKDLPVSTGKRICRHRTVDVWPWNTCVQRPFSISHTRTDLSGDPETKTLPSY